MKLIEKQKYRCALSGVELTPETAVLDHIVPITDGGGDDIDNLQWVHEEVNRMKGTMDNGQFIKTVKRIARWNG
jgi:5-methylcytosine-specific restriction endonuclease McrA